MAESVNGCECESVSMPGACSCGDLLAFCDDGMGGSSLIIKDLDLYPQPPTNIRSPTLNSEEPHISVEVAYLLTQQVREVFHQDTPAQGQRLAAHLIESLPACPIPEIARLGRTLRKWKDAFLAYFDTGGASNGPTEAINGIIELGRRTARGYRNPTNYRLRMLLIAGGLDASTHTQL